jgi:nudix-type nucleoside diphosphatase (YffH/AdpP family)
MAEVVSVKDLYRGWSHFALATFRLDNGDLVERCVEDHGPGAVVLPYDPDRRVALLVRQFRAGVTFGGGKEGPEAPAGLLEEGEDGATGARREALEETGLVLKTLESIGRYWSSPGVSTEATELFLAPYGPADRTGQGGGVDDHEDIEIVETPLAALKSALERGELGDLKLLALVQALLLKRPELFSAP